MQAHPFLPKLPVEAVAVGFFVAMAIFEIHTGGWADFLIGFICTVLVLIAWAFRDDWR